MELQVVTQRVTNTFFKYIIISMLLILGLGCYSPKDNQGQLIVLYPSGEVKIQYDKKNGKFNGLAKGFYKNGNVEYETYYEDGLPHGKYIGFYQNGSLESRGEYKNGSFWGEWLFYDSIGGHLKKRTLWDEEGIGEYVLYGNKKNIIERGTYVENDRNANGWVVKYDKNGVVTDSLHVKNNVQHGEAYHFFNGDSCIAEYNNDICIYTVCFDMEGDTSGLLLRISDSLYYNRSFYGKNKLWMEGYIDGDGNRVGKWTIYDENGNLAPDSRDLLENKE